MADAAWSYSRLSGFETCPKKFHALSVAKTIKEEPNEQTNYGKEVHLAFADFVKKGKPLPLHLHQHTALLTQLRNAPGEKIVEQQVAINRNFEPTGWFDNDVWCRVISDLTILNPPRGVLFDYKTGKQYDDFTQLRLAGAVIFQLAPEIEELTLSYIWTKNRKVTKEAMSRGQIQAVWSDFMPRINRYQAAFDKQEFPARPGIHCKWCPVKTCPYWEGKK